MPLYQSFNSIESQGSKGSKTRVKPIARRLARVPGKLSMEGSEPLKRKGSILKINQTFNQKLKDECEKRNALPKNVSFAYAAGNQ